MYKDLKWLKLCQVGAELFSTCSKRKYFACIVDNYGYVVGTGWNGVPKGMAHCSDGGCPRANADSVPGENYLNCKSIHAETNAITHSNYTARRDGGVFYINGTPCWDCAKLIANSGITRLCYIADNTYVSWPNTKILLIEAGIQLTEFRKEELDEL